MFNFFINVFNKLNSYFFEKKQEEILPQNEHMEIAPNDVKYYLVDPTLPNLIGSVKNPVSNSLAILVKNYTGQGASFDRPQGMAANVQAVLCKAINSLNPMMKIGKWALVKVLNVDPMAGVMPNAYYDRQNLKFFYFQGKSGKKVYTALSADIVTHELGHALLDAMRPEFFNQASIETWAFHESFGDINAIFSQLFEPAIVAYLLEKTGGDLKKPNILQDLAEQFGTELGLQGALRKAINTFTYVKPETLPKQGPDSTLASEPHSFSRVMTGAFYDIFVNAYESFGKGYNGVIQARDFLLETFTQACRQAPSNVSFYASFARTWISITQKKSPTLGEMMNKVFINRQIIGQPVAQSLNEKKYDVHKNLVDERQNETEIIRIHEGFVKVDNLFGEEMAAQSETFSEIMGLKLTLPLDEMLIAQSGNWEEVCCNETEACECAKKFVEYIVEKELYGAEEDKSWYKDENNFLVRKHITCCGDNGFINNCKVPGNPEFGKCWKCKNNTGCCTYGSCGCEEPPKPKVILPCRTRYNTCSTTKYNAGCGGYRYNSHPYGNNSAGINPVPYT